MSFIVLFEIFTSKIRYAFCALTFKLDWKVRRVYFV